MNKYILIASLFFLNTFSVPDWVKYGILPLSISAGFLAPKLFGSNNWPINLYPNDPIGNEKYYHEIIVPSVGLTILLLSLPNIIKGNTDLNGISNGLASSLFHTINFKFLIYRPFAKYIEDFLSRNAASYKFGSIKNNAEAKTQVNNMSEQLKKYEKEDLYPKYFMSFLLSTGYVIFSGTALRKKILG